ncbi:MAG TPA: transglycosylase SLT domain-containing protein [Candidatus Coprenecus pullistercoris]|nr:transglycosylase SLT domain-containing protein [Candidatus Coprenecus pullistercoris]
MRTVRIISAILLIFICGNILRRWEGPVTGCTGSTLSPDRKHLTAQINIKSGMYSSRGFLIGFQYTLLTGFADSLGRNMEFSGVYEHRDCWSLLAEGRVDIVAVSVSDSIPVQYEKAVSISIPFSDYAWVVRKDDAALLSEANRWLGAMTRSREYNDMTERFFRSYSLEPYLRSGRTTDRISPYDDIVKQHSKLLGWDWRLLSAVIFKESRFSMGAYSRRGAVGLMQVKRSTAESYGITDLFNPDENVRAGVMYLRQIQRRYQKAGLDPANVVKFTLAAYNAGESRMDDCIYFTGSQGGDPGDWESVKSHIPLMSQPEYYGDSELRHGKFNGAETIRYVDDVLAKYREYCSVVRK